MCSGARNGFNRAVIRAIRACTPSGHYAGTEHRLWNNPYPLLWNHPYPSLWIVHSMVTHRVPRRADENHPSSMRPSRAKALLVTRPLEGTQA